MEDPSPPPPLQRGSKTGLIATVLLLCLTGLVLNMRYELITNAAVAAIGAGAAALPSYTPKGLKFASDGTFQISVFEDLHYGEGAWTHS